MDISENLERSKSADQWVCWRHNEQIYTFYGDTKCMNKECDVNINSDERAVMMSPDVRGAQWYVTTGGQLLLNQGLPWLTEPPVQQDGSPFPRVEEPCLYWHLYMSIQRYQPPKVEEANNGEFTYMFDWPVYSLVLVRSQVQPFGVERGSGRSINADHQFMYLNEAYTGIVHGQYVASWTGERPTQLAISAAVANAIADVAQKFLDVEQAEVVEDS